VPARRRDPDLADDRRDRPDGRVVRRGGLVVRHLSFGDDDGVLATYTDSEGDVCLETDRIGDQCP
jgi:hypothetical protein